MTAFVPDQLLTDPTLRLLFCVGTGGVGKTTLSAALAVRAAQLGRKVVVVTIDPARRLAQAAGLLAEPLQQVLDERAAAVHRAACRHDGPHVKSPLLHLSS